MLFIQDGANSTLSGKRLKLVEQFTKPISNISSERDVKKLIAKASSSINTLSIMWISNLSDKIKWLFCNVRVNITVWMHYMNINETHRDERRWKLHKNDKCCFEQILEARSHEKVVVRELISHERKKNKNIQIRRTVYVGHCWISNDELIHNILLWIISYGLTRVDRIAKAYISSVQTLNANYKINQER